ncbi:MAG: hypothetical protein K0Q73_7701 [Paenibacillus sp.]|jgi:hypothetical protein|nr:hypothetical protein [Paenibacillus sp.]
MNVFFYCIYRRAYRRHSCLICSCPWLRVTNVHKARGGLLAGSNGSCRWPRLPARRQAFGLATAANDRRLLAFQESVADCSDSIARQGEAHSIRTDPGGRLAALAIGQLNGCASRRAGMRSVCSDEPPNDRRQRPLRVRAIQIGGFLNLLSL